MLRASKGFGGQLGPDLEKIALARWHAAIVRDFNNHILLTIVSNLKKNIIYP